MSKIYVGLDPSFTGYGLSWIDEEYKTITFDEFDCKIDKKSTITKFDAIGYLSEKLVMIPSYAHIGQEVSTAYTGWFIAELFALDYSTYYMLKHISQSYDLFSQTYITYITGHKSSLKEQTIFLIEEKVLPIFEKHGYSIEKRVKTMIKTDKKEGNKYIKVETITNNEADSFIYSLREFVKYSSDTVREELLEVLPKLLDDGKELK